ncbi:MAG: DUF4145 domain-containing protein [Candidatus Roizmanbacteria bacterium]
MVIIGEPSIVISEIEVAEDYLEDVLEVYQIIQCPACKKVTVRSYQWCEFIDDEMNFSILYPQNQKIPAGLPENILKAYTIALNVRNIDVNAYAVLIGRMIEMVCQDRKAIGDSLNDQLKDLAMKNEILDKLVGVAISLKNLRNIGAHAKLGDLTILEIPILDDLSHALLEYVYSAPYLVQKAENKLLSIKKLKNV